MANKVIKQTTTRGWVVKLTIVFLFISIVLIHAAVYALEYIPQGFMPAIIKLGLCGAALVAVIATSISFIEIFEHDQDIIEEDSCDERD